MPIRNETPGLLLLKRKILSALVRRYSSITDEFSDDEIQAVLKSIDIASYGELNELIPLLESVLDLKLVPRGK